MSPTAELARIEERLRTQEQGFAADKEKWKRQSQFNQEIADDIQKIRSKVQIMEKRLLWVVGLATGIAGILGTAFSDAVKIVLPH